MKPEEVERVFVLGLDCLEYNLVEEMNLEVFKQKEYGKLDVPINGRCPVTSAVWASFLTGKSPKEHGIKTLKICNNPIAQFLNELVTIRMAGGRKALKPKTTVHLKDESKGLNALLKFLRGQKKLLRKIMKKIETPHYPSREDLEYGTILDEVSKSKEYNFPFYSANFEEKSKPMQDYLDEKISFEDFIETEMSTLRKDLAEIEKELKEDENWKLLLSYTYPIDSLSHILFARKEKLKEVYLELSDLVTNILKKVPENTLIFLISDHGIDFDSGFHSNHGFFSCNKKLNLKNPQIKELKDIIETHLEGGK